MNLALTKINGTNAYLDYEKLEETIKRKLSPTCLEAELLILNNFPVQVFAEANIDVLLFLNIPQKNNNYYRIYSDEEHHNIHNLIIAVSIIKDHKEEKIYLDGNEAILGDYSFQFEEKANKLKWALTNYLSHNCKMARNKITVHPIFWLLNNSGEQLGQNTVLAGALTWNQIEKCIQLNYYIKYPGYAEWKNQHSTFEHDIRRILEQASKDSELGYITKKKVERIQNEMTTASQKAFDKIGRFLVEVKGKAGTGKSSDLLKWMLQLCRGGNRATFLTYNNLLVFEVSRQIKSFHDAVGEEERKVIGTSTANTLHSFLLNIGRKLGVMTLMTESRINSLVDVLEGRLNIIFRYFIEVNEKEPEISLSKLEMYVNSRSNFDRGTKIEAIDFLQYIKSSRFLGTTSEISDQIDSYKKRKRQQVTSLLNTDVFFKDYHGVLQNILKAIRNLDRFIDDFGVIDKFDLLELDMNLNRNLLNEGSNSMDRERLKSRYKRSINGFSAGRYLFIDEAQDCHPFEKEIFFSLFGTNRIVIANGEKEQLIRYSELCQWDVSEGQRVVMHSYKKRAQSFRMKPAIAALANHIAESFQIKLNIFPLDTEDHGTVIIDAGGQNYKAETVEKIKDLYTKGTRLGNTAYDSLLLLRPGVVPDGITGGGKSGSFDGVIGEENSRDIKITEDNVIKTTEATKKIDWDLISTAEKEMTEFKFWNATGTVDKKSLPIPGSLSVRVIYYESCRGLEAWSLMCFGIDNFFEYKRQDEEAGIFLLEEVLNTTEMRRDKYAATWVLMAITRAMDTCYLGLEKRDSKLSKVILDFAEKNPKYVTLKNINLAAS